MIKYKLLLSMAFPVANIFSFNEKTHDIQEAVRVFNNKYVNKKQITLIGISNDTIEIELNSEMELRNPTKEISAFSKLLYHDFEWGLFSQVKSRLFNIKNITSGNNELMLGKNLSNNLFASKDQSDVAFNLFAQIIMNEKNTENLDKYIKQLNKLLISAKALKDFLETED